MKRLVSALLAFLLPLAANSQDKYVSKDYDFVLYLLGNDLKQDASVLLSSEKYNPSDTLDFLKAWTAYNLQKLEKASGFFGAVPQESPFHDKSVFFNSVCQAHLGNYSKAEEILDSWSPRYALSSDLVQDTYLLERSGLALLEGNGESYLKWSSGYDGRTSLLDENFNALAEVYRKTCTGTQKKALTAALASTILPGAGQFYAGDKTKGILTFLLEGALAAIAVEQVRHYGLDDWRAAAWCGLGLTVHAFNIYGATVSVSIRNEQMSEYRNTAVLYNIHIPLRTVFR